MKPSINDLIRLGCRYGPQIRGTYINRRTKGSCVVGAILFGLGMTSEEIMRCTESDESYNELTQLVRKSYPVLDIAKVPCPICEEISNTITTLMHLNDIHLWSREAIGMWLETIESRLNTRSTTQEGILNETDIRPATRIGYDEANVYAVASR